MTQLNKLETQVDVIIVGAGLSGINAAYRMRQKLPNCTYTILEARDSIGGTWDLFRYPGIRSDTDLFTFGFEWFPWKDEKIIAEGQLILDYMQRAVTSRGIDRHILFRHKLMSANWSSEEQLWTLTVQDLAGDGQIEMHAKFLIMGTGYFDHQRSLHADIPGLSDFKGLVVHPQFWDSTLDYANKRIAVIGSGATAITLVPNLATAASHVYMIQRSPGYIMAVPGSGKPSWLDHVLPSAWLWRFRRLLFLTHPVIQWYYCRWFPSSARAFFSGQATKYLGPGYPIDPHFKPLYNPWDQRVCFAPDGDFFLPFRDGKATAVTGRIKTVKADNIIMESGEQITADIIVTATGLKLLTAGGAELSVDGKPYQIGGQLLWRNAWMQDLPNCAFLLGYRNASFTLASDTSAILVARMLKTFRAQGVTSIVPRVSKALKDMKLLPWIDLKATFIREGLKDIPVTGSIGPWKGRTNYFVDSFKSRYANIYNGLELRRGDKIVRHAE